MHLEDLHTITQQQQEADSQLEHILYVCTGTACQSSRSEEVLKAIQAELKARGLEKRCAARPGGCQGLCARGPLANLDRGKQLYQHLTPEDAPAVVEALDGEPPAHLQLDRQLPFFTRQVRVATQGGGLIDPNDLNSYIAAGGYAALLDALMYKTPAEVLQEVVKSGLRGRGGGGYSTGLKWSTVAKAVPTPKYVIVNGDEGDPGAFMDRALMEDYPFRVLEGMTLAAYAVGASYGYIYVRAEYPLAVKRLQNAIKQAQKQNLLGSNIAGTPFSFNVEIRLGAGAFVCGEETA